MTKPVDPEFEQLINYIRSSRGVDLGAYKPASLQRRVHKRMQMVGQPSLEAYRDYLEVHPDEFAQLFNVVLINVTDFFRDAPAWEFMATEALPRLLGQKPPNEPLRVWTAGCAAGQEAFTVAMLLAEALGRRAFTERVKIYATDVDEEALAEARQASYSADQVEAVPEALRERYFIQANQRYVFDSELRRSVIFGRHDLLQDAPISRVDLLTCRNTLMYFNAEAQARILSRFEFALNQGGLLFLGKAEVLLIRSVAFQPLDLKRRVFVKVRPRLGREGWRAMMEAEATSANSPEDKRRLHEVAVEDDPVAQVVLEVDGTLSLINAQARALLGLATVDVGQRVQSLQVYRPALRQILDEVVAERRIVVMKGVEWGAPGREMRYLDVTAIPLLDAVNEQPLGIKVVFNDVTRYRHLQEELHHSHQALETANEELQSSNEELETTNEELQATVEELETTNEELHSTNEELETMNEELQSINEEMEATNAELRRRSTEVNHLNAFLEAIMAGLRDGVAVLDRNLQVQAWNHSAEELWGLRSDEARGQHFYGLDIGLPVDQLRGLIRTGLQNAAVGDGAPLTVAAVNRRGKPVNVRVTATPLRGEDKSVQGVIVMMEEMRDGLGQPGAEAP